MGLGSLFKKIGGGFKSLLGGGGPKAYNSPYIGSYEEGARAGISNRLGARSYKDAQGKTQYDYSGVGRPVTKDQATSGYDFSPVSEAMASYRNPNKLTQTYKPSLFNFQGLPDEYGNKAYELGSKSVRDEGNASLEKIREATGTRRPGLLMKAAQDSQRNVADALAGLRGNIDLDVMKQKTDLGVRQQEAQAGENYKGYQSQADLEKANADEAFRNAQALGQTGLNKISAENTITENERAYNDQALEYLMNLLSSTAGFNQNAAGQAGQKRGQTLGFLGDLAKSFL